MVGETRRWSKKRCLDSKTRYDDQPTDTDLRWQSHMFRVKIFKIFLGAASVGILAAIGFGIQGQTGIAISCMVLSVVLLGGTIIAVRVTYHYDIQLSKLVADFDLTVRELARRRDVSDEAAQDWLIADFASLFDSVSSRLQRLRPPALVQEEHDQLVETLTSAARKTGGQGSDLSYEFDVAADVVDRANLVLDHLRSTDSREWEAG